MFNTIPFATFRSGDRLPDAAAVLRPQPQQRGGRPRRGRRHPEQQEQGRALPAAHLGPAAAAATAAPGASLILGGTTLGTSSFILTVIKRLTRGRESDG